MLRLLFVLLVTAFISHASPLKLSDGDHYPAYGHLSYYEDVNGTLDLFHIQNLSFHPYDSANVNFGFSTSVYWFKIDLERDSRALQKQWWLFIPYPMLEHVDLYVVDRSGHVLTHDLLGSKVPFENREIASRDFIFKLLLEEPGNVTLFIRVKTQSSVQVPLSVYSSKGLLKEIEISNYGAGLYYGIFIIIFLYNSVLYFLTRDPNHLRYIFFLSSFILWQLSFDGIGSEYLWTDRFWIIEHGTAFWIAMAAFSALYFSRHFLNTPQFCSKMDRLILVIMGISLIMAIASLYLPYGRVIRVNAAVGFIVPLVLFVAGIIVLRKNYRPARFYVVGWSSLLAGTAIFAFNKFDLIPSFYGVNHIQQFGSGIEMIFLSWALADRVHLLQREYIGKLNDLNVMLGEKVNDALLQARAKDRLFVQQSRLAAMGEMIEQIAHQWRQPLNTLALINQDLYIKFKFGKCDETCFDQAHGQIDEHLQYLSKTIDDFRNYYKTDKAKHPEDVGELVKDALRLSDVFLKYAKIKTTLHIGTSKKVNLAKNEMIQVLINLIKNAHDAIIETTKEAGAIEIDVQELEGFVEVSIEDNAGGISPDVIDKVFDIYFTTKDPNLGTGLGLHMSKYIIEESFGGTIRAENGKMGARFVILLPIIGAVKQS